MNLVTITNITDYPDKPDANSLPHIIEIYGVEVMPGKSVQIDSNFLDDKITSLEKIGYIAIGELPEFYKIWKEPPQKTQADLIAEQISMEVSPEPIIEQTPKKKGK